METASRPWGARGEVAWRTGQAHPLTVRAESVVPIGGMGRRSRRPPRAYGRAHGLPSWHASATQMGSVRMPVRLGTHSHAQPSAKALPVLALFHLERRLAQALRRRPGGEALSLLGPSGSGLLDIRGLGFRRRRAVPGDMTGRGSLLVRQVGRLRVGARLDTRQLSPIPPVPRPCRGKSLMRVDLGKGGCP